MVVVVVVVVVVLVVVVVMVVVVMVVHHVIHNKHHVDILHAVLKLQTNQSHKIVFIYIICMYNVYYLFTFAG